MKVKVESITGFEAAFVSMFISKRTWTPELNDEIYRVCDAVLDKHGHIIINDNNILERDQFKKWLTMLLRMGRRHITVLRFIDITIMTEGLHRAGQDDVDAHVKRFENRIIRSSTRLAEFQEDEMSEWYKDKIITDGTVIKSVLGIEMPETVEYEGCTYVKSPNGYVKKEYENDKDVKRGLYMLSIPSNFISKINLCEWGHVYSERNENGGANPEVKIWAEAVMDEIERMHDLINRDIVLSIKN